jgi:DNA-binding MarR family transcriptional regulator
MDDKTSGPSSDAPETSAAHRIARSRQFPDLLRIKHQQLGSQTERDLDVIELITNLTRLNARLVQDFENAVHRPLNLTWAGFRILNALWVFDGLQQQDIGRMSGTSRASVSSALTTLETRGLVSRRRTASDRRNVDVWLTPDGIKALHRAISAQTRREQAWTSMLSDDDVRTLMRLLRTLVDRETPSKSLPEEE